MAQVDAGAKSHSEVCCERIRQVMMNDDVGQQRLHAAEQRVSPAGELQSVATRVEAAQDGPGEAMRQAPAASSARNVKPRVEVSLEDSTRVSSRLQDGSPSRKRGSEEVGPKTQGFKPADGSMGISEMAAVALATF